MSLEQAKIFLAKVLPWPQQGEAGYVNIHWTSQKNGEDRLFWQGRAVTTVDAAAKTIQWALGLKDTRGIYACMSSQREMQPVVSKTGHKYNKAVRLQENAVALKSFFLDLDVKDGGYASFKEAVAALQEFIKVTGLPKPSIMVATGGGMHVHWTVSQPLPPAEWYQLACALTEAGVRHGLKFDHITTDASRVLRVPDTFNHKLDEPRPVKLLGVNDFDYSLERIAKPLQPYKVQTTFLAGRSNGLAFEQPPTQAPKAPLAGTSDLAAGIETTMPLLELKACLDNIPRPADTPWDRWNTIGMRVYSATEGADYGLEEWTRWSGGDEGCAAAWERFRGTPPTRTGAGALVNEVRNLTGNATWRPIAPAQAVAAANTAQVPAANGAGALLPHAPSNDMPDGYTRTATGIVCLIGVNADNTPSQTPVSEYPLVDPRLTLSPWRLYFYTMVNVGQKAQISIDLKSVNTEAMRKELQEQGFMLRANDKLFRSFIVSWIQKLQQTRLAVVSAPFGWASDGKKGFVYAGRTFFPGGESPAVQGDPGLATQYSPAGDLQPWIEAVDMITLQERPGLNAIIASAFAAPLVKISGQTGLLMSTFSQDTGIGKSSAVYVAQSVWGKSIRTQGLDDTVNSVVKKMGQLRSLPIYWDEIKDEEDYKAVSKLVFKLTRGVEKNRLKSTTAFQDSGEWQTLFCTASNDSLIDYVINRTPTTPAGLVRVFEFSIEPGTKGQISRTDADQILGRLRDNYGQAGLIYAKFLGENQARIEKEWADFDRALGVEMKATPDERFWLVLMSALLLGAKYANELRLTDIDEQQLKTFLVEVLQQQRDRRGVTGNDLRKEENISSILAQFISAMAGRHMLRTNRIHITAGKPVPGSIKALSDTNRLDGVYVHYGQDDKMLRISSAHLSEWLKEKQLSRSIVLHGIKPDYGSRPVKGILGGGTPVANLFKENLIEINIAGMPLADMMTDTEVKKEEEKNDASA